MFLLVLLFIDVLGLSSFNVPLRTDTLRLADHTWILSCFRFAGLRSFPFDQTLLDQFVAGNLKGVEVPDTDTALEESSILGTFLCEFTYFLTTEFEGMFEMKINKLGIQTSLAHFHQHKAASPVVVSFPSQSTVFVNENPYEFFQVLFGCMAYSFNTLGSMKLLKFGSNLKVVTLLRASLLKAIL